MAFRKLFPSIGTYRHILSQLYDCFWEYPCQGAVVFFLDSLFFFASYRPRCWFYMYWITCASYTSLSRISLPSTETWFMISWMYIRTSLLLWNSVLFACLHMWFLRYFDLLAYLWLFLSSMCWFLIISQLNPKKSHLDNLHHLRIVHVMSLFPPFFKPSSPVCSSITILVIIQIPSKTTSSK